jgi:hypothetical protein
MTDPCEGKYDIVSRLRDHTNRDDNDIAEAAAYIERLRAERDEARLQTGRILNEIDCRIEHGAESNGHLEAIHNLFKENNNA